MTQKQNSKRLKFRRFPRIGVFQSSELSEFKIEAFKLAHLAVSYTK